MRSMTGFGKASTQNDTYELIIELRSVNNRYLELAIRLPREFSAFENKIRSLLKAKIMRGKVNVFLSLNRSKGEESQTSLEPAIAKKLFVELNGIAKDLNIDDTVTIQDLLQFYALREPSAIQLDDETFMELLEPALEKAVSQLNAMRDKEGGHLRKDIIERLGIIEELSSAVSEKGKLNVQETFNKMVQNVEDLIGAKKIDMSRLEQEIALISDKVDITEEYVRMTSHLKLFHQTIEKPGEVGKKLTFILQEMLREANTMNSKSTQVEIQHKVIRIKEEIEKIREQVQNIE